jgi:hypothetical protein
MLNMHKMHEIRFRQTTSWISCITFRQIGEMGRYELEIMSFMLAIPPVLGHSPRNEMHEFQFIAPFLKKIEKLNGMKSISRET